MKKLLCLTLVLLMALSLITMPASAAFTPRYVGTVYASNSTCSINNYPIKCYVMDGYMFVQVEDLNNYGFDVVWNSYNETLRIMKDDNKAFTNNITVSETYIPHSNNVGAKLFDMTTTNVSTYIGDYAYEIECLAGMPGCTYINVDNLSVFGDMSWNNDNERMYIWTSNPDYYPNLWTSRTSPYDVPWYEHDGAEYALDYADYNHYYEFSYIYAGNRVRFYFGQHSRNVHNDELAACTLCSGTFYVDIYDQWNRKVYSTSKKCGWYDYNPSVVYALNHTDAPLNCEIVVPYEYFLNSSEEYRAVLTFWCDEGNDGFSREYVLK